MSTNKLDQPDNYSGIHNQVHIKQFTVDAITYTAHLLMDMPQHWTLTYCGAGNPYQVFNTQGIGCAPQMTPTIGQLLRNTKPLQLHGHPVTYCPACMSMALCQAEMLGQRYKIKTTIRAMDALPLKQNQEH
ncbi:hypothetical protein [Corynebacterium ulcerans]|uniref:hypothetical protein n=1 Tax=Corynebacterium ulcerans TaxID=65058 RepID=UPI0018D6DEC5|nr:hypothetical protein [Corynebacterium ulcerans]MBH5297508.1 hypothetical protein [Corynebacterium ulcerans]